MMVFLHKNQKPRLKKRRIVLYVLLAIAALGAAVFIGCLRWYNNNLKPVNPGSSEQISYSIPPGTATSAVAARLEELGIIKNELAFTIFLRLNDRQNDVQAGNYELSPSQSVSEIIDVLSKGIARSSTFTFIPGKRIDQIRTSLIDAGFTTEDVDAALIATNYANHPISEYKPPAASLEGYLFPETFSISKQSSAQDLVKLSLDELDKALTPDLIATFNKQGLSIHEALTLASIVEKEVSNEADKPLVAQVFLSRLELGMTLGSDVTFIYASEVFGGPKLPSLDNPYNTRLYGGLPPGPIANSSLNTLQAVANPSSTDYLYFVAGDDGVTRFARTLPEHNDNVAKYCFENCKL